MKRLPAIFLILGLLLALCVPAMAVSQVESMQNTATLAQDGNCQMAVTLHLRLDAPMTDLTFPLPAEAQNVLLGGSFVSTQVSGNKLLVQLPNLTAGDHYFTLTYSLPDVLTSEKGETMLTLPLLGGFRLPIQAMSFSVTLPGEITGTPSFFSGYYQEDIATQMTAAVSGHTLTGTVLVPLKDHETLTLTLPVEPELFPLADHLEPLLNGWEGAMLLCLLLAVIYYLLTLMPQLSRRSRCFTPPDGISAGEVGVCLTGTGVDLTLMVLTWAQLGYLDIEVRGKRQVLLHKRMEMGNERSDFEVRAYQQLFHKRRMVDGSGVHYARLLRKLSLQAPMYRQLFQPQSGHPMVFRVLSCSAGAISGIQLGLAIGQHPVPKVLLAIVLCLLCAAFSYFIQAGGKCLPLRNKAPLWIAIGCSAAWIALGALTAQLSAVIPMVLIQLVCGIAMAYGGRRSVLGRRSLAQIRGLRHYMVRANTFELQQRLQANSNYYYALAPYALALGVDKRFARRFGKTALPECGFLILEGKQPTTASEWAHLLRHIADTLNARQKRFLWEQLFSK